MRPDELPTITDDAALGGRLQLLQPAKGHRFGHDAILLAAAVEANKGERIVDLGAGVGTAGLAVAVRLAGVEVTLVDIDPALTKLASENAARNRCADRVRVVTLDVAATPQAFTAQDLTAESVDWVMMNPPFHDAVRMRPSPVDARRAAHVAAEGGLETWLSTAARLLKPQGRVALIYRADGLIDVLSALNGTFGAIEILPIYPRPHAAAIRVVVRATKASRAPLTLHHGLTLSDEDAHPTPAAEAILRRGAALVGLSD